MKNEAAIEKVLCKTRKIKSEKGKWGFGETRNQDRKTKIVACQDYILLLNTKTVLTAFDFSQIGFFYVMQVENFTTLGDQYRYSHLL